MIKLFLLLLTSLLSAKEVLISFDKPYSYNKRLSESNITIPKNPVIPIIDGFKINRAQYKNFFKLKLAYILFDKTKVQEQYNGKFWHISQKSDTKIEGSKELRMATRDALFQSYKQALEDAGATLYESRTNPEMRVIFNLDNIWGVISVYASSFEIKAVEVEAFKQSLKIDPDELLAELQKSGEVKLDGVYFDTGNATLRPRSKQALLAAASVLKKYPTLVLEVQGHTDSVGSNEANRILSENRAKSVKNALISEGVDSKRLESKGYGETVPIASNETAKGRAQNRRVVLKKLSGGDEKVLISIDFMKPMPGFKKALIREYPDEKMHFRFNQKGHGHTYIIGDEVRAEYDSINKKICTCSYLEILKNYEGVLTSFGAEIVGKDFPGAQNIYFHIKDRGDGKEIYGVVKAYNCGSYTISFLIPKE
jgi:outer membrane protein OmpA-like peptidoglycan-associated protein